MFWSLAGLSARWSQELAPHPVHVQRAGAGAAGGVAAGAAAEPAFFSAEDVFDLEYASDPRTSPDGKRIVYVRRANDIMRDRTRADLWSIGVDGSRHRPLVVENAAATSPRFSPSGDRLAWVRSAPDGPEIIVRWLDGDETAPIARLRERPRNLSWSPNGRWIAFTQTVAADAQPLAPRRSGPEGSEWSAPVKVIDAVRYKRDGAGFLEASYRHVFVVPAEGGTPRQLTSGDFEHRGPLGLAVVRQRPEGRRWRGGRVRRRRGGLRPKG